MFYLLKHTQKLEYVYLMIKNVHKLQAYENNKYH